MATAHPSVGGHTRTAFRNPEGWIHLIQGWLSLVQTHMRPFTGLLSYSFCECLWSVPKRGRPDTLSLPYAPFLTPRAWVLALGHQPSILTQGSSDIVPGLKQSVFPHIRDTSLTSASSSFPGKRGYL